jgi:hypothetical protein
LHKHQNRQDMGCSHLPPSLLQDNSMPLPEPGAKEGGTEGGRTAGEAGEGEEISEGEEGGDFHPELFREGVGVGIEDEVMEGGTEGGAGGGGGGGE